MQVHSRMIQMGHASHQATPPGVSGGGMCSLLPQFHSSFAPMSKTHGPLVPYHLPDPGISELEEMSVTSLSNPSIDR